VGEVTSPHRDETETLRRRLAVLRQENAELEWRRSARLPIGARRKSIGLLVALACIVAPMAGGCVGCTAGLRNPVRTCPT
jgi:hypothetical protein